MEPQINQFRIFEVQSTINSANEHEHEVLNVFLCDAGLKLKIAQFKQCVGTLALLPPRNVALFERQYLLEHYTQRANNFTMCQVSLAL